MKRLNFLLLFLVLSLLLSACYSEVGQPDTTASPSTSASGEESSGESTAPSSEEPQEERPEIPVAHSYSPDNQKAVSSMGGSAFPVAGGFYKGSSPITYFDIEHEAKVVMCNLAGCSHNTDACPAYIRNLKQLLATEEAIYAFCQDYTSVWLVKLNLQTYEKTTEFSVEGKDDVYYYINTAFYSTGHIFVRLNRTDENSSGYCTYLYDTESGETELFFQDTKLQYLHMIGSYGNTVLLYYGEYDEAPMTLDEYVELHPEQSIEECMDEYVNVYTINFSKEHHTGGRYFYDLEAKTYTEAYPALQGDSQEIPYTNYSSDGEMFGEYVLYKLGNAVMRYSLKTGERELLVDAPNIINGNLNDDKLEYLKVIDGTISDGTIEVHIYDIASGEDYVIETHRSQEPYFSLYTETADAFIGYRDGQAWILKEDYYNGRFENAHKY